MTAQIETQNFQAETQELLDLMIHSLYTHQEIFLRELVSNASDALDRVRFQALTDSELLEEGEELGIEISSDEEERTLTITDNGIGMDREDLVRGLGTIANSGTRRFLEEVKERGEDTSPELIGQFGVGFYSSFMVADRVVVETRKAGTETGWRWSSVADGEYTIEEVEGLPRGTSIRLHLKEEDEEGSDYLDESKLRSLVTRYSDFVEHPIRLGEETLNSMRPIWTRPKSEITAEEHADFYRHLTHDFREPSEVIHFNAEGTLEYTALLYIPAERPFDLLQDRQPGSRLALYVKRIQVSDECEDLLPTWLRFVRGVVEASDLPLNVSREILQSNPHVRAIQKRLTKKVLSSLETLAGKDHEKYEKFWDAFGPVLKEGICAGEDEDSRIAKLCLFRTSDLDGWSTLASYIARMPEEQESIFYITGADRETLASSPHLEVYRKKNFEVLYLTDPIDEWLIDSLQEYDGKPLRSVHAADAGVGDEEEEEIAEATEKYSALFEKLAAHLGEDVKEVRLTSRLTDSPAVLVSEAGAQRPHLERMMREMHGRDARTPRILELNAGHPSIQGLQEMFTQDEGSQRVLDHADLLFGQALLAEGSNLPDPARFSRLVSELMIAAT
jgi:molecular chaperone HtpG